MEEKEQLTKLSSETLEINSRLDTRRNVILTGELIGRKEIAKGIDYVKEAVLRENPTELTRDSINNIESIVNDGLSEMRNGYRIIDRNFLCGIDCGYQVIEVYYNLKGIKVKKIVQEKIR